MTQMEERRPKIARAILSCWISEVPQTATVWASCSHRVFECIVELITKQSTRMCWAALRKYLEPFCHVLSLIDTLRIRYAEKVRLL